MKLVDKYLLREHAVPLSCCLITFSMVFVIYDLFDNLIRFLKAETPWRLVLRYYGCMLQPTWDALVPASLLLATLYTLWHLARNNELSAMRASGVSLYRITMPFLAVGLLLTVVTATVKETVAPRAGLWAAEFVARQFSGDGDVVEYGQAFYRNVIAGRIWQVNLFSAMAPEQLRGIKITQEREDGTKQREIIAEWAFWLDGQWWFFDGFTQDYHPNESRDGGPLPLPAGGSAFASFDERPDDFAGEVKPWEFLSSREMMRYLAAHPALSAETRAQKTTDLHGRLALPWSCFIATLFAVPAGAGGGRHSALRGVFTAVGLFFAFYALMQVGVYLGKRSVLAPWLGAWLSNVVFLVAGLHMMRRIR